MPCHSGRRANASRTTVYARAMSSAANPPSCPIWLMNEAPTRLTMLLATAVAMISRRSWWPSIAFLYFVRRADGK